MSSQLRSNDEDVEEKPQHARSFGKLHGDPIGYGPPPAYQSYDYAVPSYSAPSYPAPSYLAPSYPAYGKISIKILRVFIS